MDDLTGGAPDPQGPGSRFPAVVGVWGGGGGIGTGTALSDRVVVTAGHLVPDMLRGCAPFVYQSGTRGVDDASGVDAGDIWHRAVEGQSPWTRAPLGAHRVGHVLAATWSHVDDRLWVVDEVPNAHGKGKSKRVRLYRIEPYLGVVSMVGDWPRQPVVDQHWLVLDLDGQVLLVTSSATAMTHLVARFEATPYDSLAPLGFSVKRRPGALVLAPIVDELGYSFAFAGPGGVPQLVRREARDLPPGGPAELEGAL